LLPGFNRTRPYRSHTCDRIDRLHAQLDQKAVPLSYRHVRVLHDNGPVTSSLRRRIERNSSPATYHRCSSQELFAEFNAIRPIADVLEPGNPAPASQWAILCRRGYFPQPLVAIQPHAPRTRRLAVGENFRPPPVGDTPDRKAHKGTGKARHSGSGQGSTILERAWNPPASPRNGQGTRFRPGIAQNCTSGAFLGDRRPAGAGPQEQTI
jgi:hypothetical protein